MSGAAPAARGAPGVPVAPAAPVVHTTAALAELVGGVLVGPPDLSIRSINAIDAAGPDEITLIAAERYARRWGESSAAAALVSRPLEPAGHDPQRRALIYVDDAEVASIALLELFAPAPELPAPGVHPMATVDPAATLGAGVRVGAHASIGRGAVIGAGVAIGEGAVVYPDVTIGDGSVLHARCVVRERCRLGRRVVLHAGAVIGSDGFGYRLDPAGGGLRRLPHLGNVELGDDVEIGANTCIDRAKFGATVVGAGTKIDNLVQIGHNCRIGRCCVIAGGAGLSGSVQLGDGVRVGGLAGFAEHVRVGDGGSVGAMSGVLRDVPPGGKVFGAPADEASAALRQVAALRKLPALIRRLPPPLKADRRD